jgi:serine O-acetyltransferase
MSIDHLSRPGTEHRTSPNPAGCRPRPGNAIWPQIQDEAWALLDAEPALADLLHNRVLDHESLLGALACHLAHKLAEPEVGIPSMLTLLRDVLDDDSPVGDAACADLAAVRRRDPACNSYLEPLLYFKGFLGLQAYRAANQFWRRDRRQVALYLQSRVSEVFGVDIHPAACIGYGIMIDHATGVVVGETAVIEDDVSLLHEVTLGGTGKTSGDRHPKVRQGAMIGAGAKILGNVEIGQWARVGAGSVVLRPVPAFTTVVGTPAKVVRDARPPIAKPAEEMDQVFAGCRCRRRT